MSKLDIIIGCMFSGKTTETLRRCSKETIFGASCCFVNSSFDNRGSNVSNFYSTHNPLYQKDLDKHPNGIQFINVFNLTQSIPKLLEFNVICIDESQFFEASDLIFAVREILKHSKYVIVSGLNCDSNQEKFGGIIDLICIADNVTFLHAICKDCANLNVRTPAIFSYRHISSSIQLDVGGKEKYIPLCRKCFEKRKQ